MPMFTTGLLGLLSVAPSTNNRSWFGYSLLDKNEDSRRLHVQMGNSVLVR